MSIVYNNKQIQHAYYGETPIHQIYLGDQLKWADMGGLYAFGRNNFGQLGIGDTTQRTTPVKVGESSDWVQVACGGYHTIAINSSGELYAWGYNLYGQLGLGDTTYRNAPVQIGSATDWMYVACGGYDGYGHSLAINSSGELYAWGYNASGQLGLGDTTDRDTPTRVGVASNWGMASCGGGRIGGEPYFGYSLALNSSGELYAWGENYYGQLGLGDVIDRDTPTRVGVASDWISVVGSHQAHTLAINSSGELYACGLNSNGQLGLGDTADRTTLTRVGASTDWTIVAAGELHSLAINSFGELYAWGYNLYGELGLGDATDRDTPTKVGSATDWVYAVCGARHSLASDSSGRLYTWGRNSNGQLGVGDTTDRYTPNLVAQYQMFFSISAGSAHSLLIKL